MSESSRVDWTTTAGCARCDEHGPFLPPAFGAMDELNRDSHRAWHAAVAVWMRPVVWAIERLARKVT